MFFVMRSSNGMCENFHSNDDMLCEYYFIKELFVCIFTCSMFSHKVIHIYLMYYYYYWLKNDSITLSICLRWAIIYITMLFYYALLFRYSCYLCKIINLITSVLSTVSTVFFFLILTEILSNINSSISI